MKIFSIFNKKPMTPTVQAGDNYISAVVDNPFHPDHHVIILDVKTNSKGIPWVQYRFRGSDFPWNMEEKTFLSLYQKN
jgi:hypothetical protein